MRTVVLSAFLLSSVAGAQTPPATQPQTAPPTRPDPFATSSTTQPAPIAFDSLGEKERAQIESLLQSPDWPIRVFALLRLERYAGNSVVDHVERMLKDQSWQVRCFAIRQAQRMKIEIAAESFAE